MLWIRKPIPIDVKICCTTSMFNCGAASRYSDGRCSLRTWTYRVAHNVAVSHMIRRSKAPVLLTLEQAAEFAGDMSAEAEAGRRKALDRLLALVRDLYVLDRQVILSRLEGLDAEQISELTGITKVNVLTRILRIRCILRRSSGRPWEGIDAARRLDR